MTSHPRRPAAVLAVVAALASLFSPLSAHPAGAQTAPPGLIPEGHWVQPQIDWMVDKIAETEAVLPQRFPTSYDDGGTALEAMGYMNFGATAPGGYDHWIQRAWIVDGHILNPNFPESLIYQQTGNGVWELKAAMFMLVPEWDVPDIPPLISWIPGWHGHPELCVDAGGRFAGITDPDAPNCPPGTTSAMTPVMTHIWLEDPGCGHRFGGVGVGGLHCDVGHEM
ncbi:MAG TPA: hypothetical protein VFI47_19965 [Acidimicrobiales bacterium]|nr:hypothetical protein [Acidimicrobiales bacterium]